jgi:outer membrane protein assembly factor BamB
VSSTFIRATLAAALLTTAASAAAPRDADAVVTSRWLVDTYKEFHEGEVDGALITSLGEIRPGFGTEHVDLEFSDAWSAVRAPDGTVYVGTDQDGGIYAIQGNRVRSVAEIPDAVAVVSLALAADGTLFAGTMPGGAIWRVSPAGAASELVALDDVETVWSLAIATGGKLYAGTGPSGVLYAIDPSSGAAEVAFETGEKRIMSLAATSDGAVWLGTSDQARVFRHVPERGITRAMADFAGNEVTALAPWNDGVVATANQFQEPTTPRVKTATAVREATQQGPRGEEPEMPEAGSAPGAEAPTPRSIEPRQGSRQGKGALYHVRGDGQLRQLHALTATYISAVATTDDGRVFVGAGENGRIYLIDTDGSVSTAIDVPQRLIAHLLWHPDQGLGFTTADATAYYRTTGAAATATYESKVFDADAPSRFGRIAWRSEGNVAIETRSGNTAEPGPGWSPWQAPRDPSGVGARRTGIVASPPARYLQYRARFNSDSSAVLRQTLLYYLPQNRPTRITRVTIEGHDPSELVTTQAGSASPRSPVVTIRWDVDNPDDDATAYTVDVRREGELRWRRLPSSEDPLTQTRYRWNTETFPDGYYRIRVTASDHLANSPDRAQQHHHTTPLFLVDNDKPTISDITVRYPSASARASDRMSPIAEMSYSVNDGPWQVGTTRDGLFDSLTEILQIDLPRGLESGTHTLSIRVADEAGNIGTASTTFAVP